MTQKTYVLGMFPYPSGEGLHVGHVRIFTACDVMARYFRLKGEGEVLSPMGWDAFGLPAENAAIKNKKIPQEMVPHNYANFKKQMQNLSLSFDWEREFATTDPEYYAITQWIFLQLYKKGLVYREEVPINWCPKCKTGLANEEVMADGTHERCGTVVGKKNLPQWVMKITAYAERLLNDLDIDLHIEGKKLDPTRPGLDWPKGILEMQRNWIGKKEGVVIKHQVKDTKLTLETFSAYPAWLFADTFIVLAPEHPMVEKLIEGMEQADEVKKFVQECAEITDQQRLEDKFEKKGAFTGRYAMDPFNPGREMPIWVANFAMMGFGTGVIRCSSHDVRDYAFAQKYGIETMSAEVVERLNPNEPINAHDNAGVLVKSGPFTGREINPSLIEEMKNWIVKEGIGRKEVTYHLRDWVFSRQRYWGEPIPLVYCDKCGDENGVVPLPEDQLPLTLPELDHYEPTDTGESPLARVADWVSTKCPQCGGPARRETDTMPNWAGSCWYFLAFPFWAAKKAGEKINNLNDAKKYIKEWMSVDWYLGGAEHAVLHLLYARFWVKVLQDLGIIDFPEPFLRLRSVGMVLAEDGRKMSKSLGNVVNPDDMVEKYGSDAVRMYEMFMGPWEQSIAWDSGAISGQVRFLGRIREAVKRDFDSDKSSLLDDFEKFRGQFHWTIKRVEEGILDQKFNTAIAEIMKLVNSWNQASNIAKLSTRSIKDLLIVLSPFAPKLAQELWEHIGEKSKVDEQSWPEFDQKIASIGGLVVAVQINGKLRTTIEFQRTEAMYDEKTVVATALADPKVKKWLNGEPKKVIFVPGRLVNLVG